MVYQARWGTKGFITSTTKLVPMMDFKATMAVKSDSQSDSSGASQTNVKGKEPEIVTFNTRYLTAAGVNPWDQVEEWRSLLGKANPLYIGGKRFGPAKFMLKSVEVSETLLSPTGEFIGLKVTLTLEENVTSTTKKATQKTTTAVTGSVVATTAETSTDVTQNTEEIASGGASWFSSAVNKVKETQGFAQAVDDAKSVAFHTDPSDEDRTTLAKLLGNRKETKAKATTASTSTTLSGKVSTVQYHGKTYPVKSWAKYGDWIRGFYYHPIISVDGKNVTVYSYRLVE